MLKLTQIDQVTYLIYKYLNTQKKDNVNILSPWIPNWCESAQKNYPERFLSCVWLYDFNIWGCSYLICNAAVKKPASFENGYYCPFDGDCYYNVQKKLKNIHDFPFHVPHICYYSQSLDQYDV